MDASIALTDLQKQKVPLKEVNVFKKPAPILGVPAISVDKSGIISIFPADDGSFVEIDAIAAGVAIVTVVLTTVGGKTLTAHLTVTVTVDPRSTEATDILFDTTIAPVDEVV